MLVLCMVTAITLLAFLQRWSLARVSPTDFDAFGHMYFARLAKDQNANVFGGVKANICCVEEKIYNPLLWHKLLAYFNLDWIFKHRQFVNVVLDALMAGFVVYKSIDWGLTLIDSFLVGLLYILTPVFYTSIATGPRVLGITPRLSSEIAFNLLAISLVEVDVANPVSLLIPCSLGVFMFSSSKFGSQVMIFMLPLISVFTFSLEPLIVLVLSVFFSFVIGGKSFFHMVVNGQLRHLIWTFRKNMRGEVNYSIRMSMMKLFNQLSDSYSGPKLWAVWATELIRVKRAVAVVFKFPALIVAGFLFIYAAAMGIQSVTASPLIGYILAGVILLFVISWKKLLFLGEPERYLNHVAYFVIFACVHFCAITNNIWLVYCLVLYGLVFFSAEYFVTWKRRHIVRSEERADQQVIDLFNKYKDQLTILPYPFHAVGAWRIMLQTKHATFFPIIWNSKFQNEFEGKYILNYPYVEIEKLPEMSVDYGINALVIRKDEVTRGDFKMDYLPQDWVEIGTDIGLYRLFIHKQAV